MSSPKYIPLISFLLRAYLKYSPITEGKKRLAQILYNFSIPPSNYIISSMKDEYKLRLNLKNKEHVHMFLYSEHDERYERRILKKIIKNGDIIWDVGANIGYYTLLFSTLSPDGKTIAFEPASQTRNMLMENININERKNILIQDYALGNSDSDSEIFFSDGSFAEGTASLIKDKDKNNSEKIRIQKIDSLEGKVDSPDFIKIDVEGLHNEVLKGGESFLKNNAPLMMIELKDTPERDYIKKVESMEIFQRIGYTAFEIKKHGLVMQHDLHSGRARNYILCKKESHLFKRIQPLVLESRK